MSENLIEKANPIRVAQIMTEMNYGGVEMVVMNYYRHIDRKKVQFDFFVIEGSKIPQREEIESLGGRIYIVPKYTKIIQYERTLIELFKENKYQIVHSHMNTLSILSLRAAKKAGVPIRIAHNHSTAGKGEYKKNILKYMLRPFAKIYPTHLCACSKYAGEWIYGEKSSFKVINNAIEISRFIYSEANRNRVRKELQIDDKFVVGNIGRICYQKNHDFLIDIFVGIHEQNEKAVLLLIGEGELADSIHKKVEKLEIEQSVIFLGKQNDTSQYYHAMDVFLLPSRYEGLPVVAVEAQAAGLPCVITDCVTEETKILDSTVFLNLDNAIDDWTTKVIEVAQSFKRKDTSSLLIEEGFDINIEAEKLIQYYYQLLSIISNK